MTHREKIVMSNLLKEIENKDLQMILRRVMFSGENVTEAILQERPDLTIKDVKDKYEKIS
jgi:hypothetical protein